jgi:hypothetical protein
MPFKPGQSGNPAGRPRGSRNKATIVAEELLADSAGELTKAAIARAIDGDPAALRVCMDRLVPPLRHRPLDFDLPQLVTLADAPVAINAIAQGLAHGELDREAAAVLLRAVRAFTRALAAVERAKRAARIGVRADQGAQAGPKASPTSSRRGPDEPDIVSPPYGRARRAMPLRHGPGREALAVTRNDAVRPARVAHRLLPISGELNPISVAHRDDAEDHRPRGCAVTPPRPVQCAHRAGCG